MREKGEVMREWEETIGTCMDRNLVLQNEQNNQN